MQKSFSSYLTIICCSLFSAVAGVWIYNSWVDPVKKIYIEESLSPISANAENPFLEEAIIRNNVSRTPVDFVGAAAQGKKAVVFIRAMRKINQGAIFDESYFAASGSGVIISSDGYIVTNNHVIDGAAEVEVTLNNKKEYKAKVVGTDETTDIALLKIKINRAPFLNFGDSDSLMVGEWVMAVGNPFRLQSTVTAGIVSAKARNINLLENNGIESFIQTDAAVNPGNSGGALVNTKGQLVGINTAILSESGGYEGFSFAVPSNLVRKIILDLKEFGAVQRGWLGVSIQNVNDDIASDLDLPSVSGVYVEMVTSGGAAKAAGIRKGDVLISVDGTITNTVPLFMEQVGRYRPGDKVQIDFYRNGRKISVAVTLRNQLNTTDFVAVRKDKILLDLGFELRDLDSKEKRSLKTSGIYVVSVYSNSQVADSNLEPGYVITNVNGRKINDVENFISILNNVEGEILLKGFYENYPGEFAYSLTLE